MKPKIILALIFIFALIAGYEANAQNTKVINGIVTGFKNIPLNNVKITAIKSGNTVYTDPKGQFSIKCLTTDQLEITAGGFIKKKVKIGKENLYQVNLAYTNKETSFNEAVKNKHMSEEDLQKAVYAMSSGLKDYSHYDSIFELVDSEVYEVNVKGNSITNKKVKSFDSNPQVLYVVDDKIVSDISYISPMYVKSIEFVEDVGATMYGSRGANGVLKIRLK